MLYETNHKFARLAADRLACYQIYANKLIPMKRARFERETDGRVLRRLRREYAETITQAISFFKASQRYADLAARNWSNIDA